MMPRYRSWLATGIRRDRARRDAEAAIIGLREMFTTLSPRERDVAMPKMGAATLADLVRMAAALSQLVAIQDHGAL